MTARESGAGIRPARHADLEAIVEIYNHYVRNTPITFDTEAYSAATREPWFLQFGLDGPHRLLVAELGGDVVAYACSSRFKERQAYSTSVETSIYVRADSVSRGLGTQLYTALIAELVREPKLHRAYGGITVPNAASVALHEKLGYRQVARYGEVGFKLGRYWDVCWFERNLDA